MHTDHNSEQAAEALSRVKAPWLTGAAGLAVIMAAFAVSLLNATFDEPNRFVSLTLQPFIFVGIGLLLYHIGLHVHAVHQNVILMAMRNAAPHDAVPK